MNDGTPPLLHNMSVAPRTVLEHRCDAPRVFGRGVVFELVGIAADCTPANLHRLLTGQEGDEDDLRRLLNEHARTLPLPAAAFVADRPESGDRRCGSPLDAATVLSKSSGNVYLRDKEPNLAGIVPGRRIVILIPETEQP